jgi:hypothetical protein
VTFTDAILASFGRGDMFVTDAGKQFQAITETDLAYRLRERGWKLPSNWLYQVEKAGFTVKQVYAFGGVARAYSDGGRGRHLNETNTLITL